MFKKGDKVILADNATTREEHRNKPEYYPKPGTRGVVLEESTVPIVQWEIGSTSLDDVWAVGEGKLILDEGEREMTEYVDWTKVPIDTEIWVKDNNEKEWFKRHFAGYEEETGKVKAFKFGNTSMSTDEYFCYDCAKLAKDEEHEEMNDAKFEKGDKVIFADTNETRDLHIYNQRYYPAPGTMGEIVSLKGNFYMVKWEEGRTAGDGIWAASETMLKPFCEGKGMNDVVNHPSHYTSGKIEVIDYIEDQKLPYHLGNVVKHISRAGKKDPAKTVEDLKKAEWYLHRYIGLLENNEGEQK